MEPFAFDESWDVVRALLPKDLEALARDRGCVRRLRGIESVEVLIRLLLMHGSGLSLEQAAWRAREQGLAELSGVALFKRLRQSGPLLEALCQHVLEGLQARLGTGQWPGGYRYRAIDATDISEPGATGSCWRVHYSLRLPQLSCDGFELSSYEKGETFKRWNIGADEVVLADRAYSHRGPIGELIKSDAKVVVRLNTGLFPLTHKTGKPMNLLKELQGLSVGKPEERRVWFSWAKKLVAIRLCVVRKTQAAADTSRKKALRRAQQDGVQLQEATLALADYVLVLTNLDAEMWAAPKVLELYRCRWQIELAFKRLKSLLALGHLPKKDPPSAQAWMHTKLLLALLTERLMWDAKLFFPWGCALQPD
jgi:hypothetical protein